MSKNVLDRILKFISVLVLLFTLSACGFHARGPMPLALPLHRLYIQAADPYSHLVRVLQDYLKASNVVLTDTPQQANTVLVILSDTPSQQLLSVSSTQLTRQYLLMVSVLFEIQSAKGVTILGPQTLIEQRVITIQSSQILGSSNEANLFYQQMRRELAFGIMNRIASKEVSKLVNDALISPAVPSV